MKKIEVNLKVLMAIIVLLGLSLGIMAQQPPRQQQPRPQQYQTGKMGGFGMLNLTDEQKAEMKKIHISQAKQLQPMKDELLINKAKINAQVHKDKPDMKEIVNLVEANGKIFTQIQVNEIESHLQVRNLLNNEQKVTFDSHYGKMQHNKAMAQLGPQHMRQGRNR